MTPRSETGDVVVYGRPGCHLCDIALTVIRRVQADRPFTLSVIDIESDDALFRAYLERIPVVMVGGVERFTFRVDETGFREALSNLDRPVADRDPA